VDGIRDFHVTGVQTCALPICTPPVATPACFGGGNRDPPPASSCRSWIISSEFNVPSFELPGRRIPDPKLETWNSKQTPFVSVRSDRKSVAQGTRVARESAGCG